MSPTAENPQALTDTAAYAQELKRAGIDDDVVDIAGYGFIRGRMASPERVEAAANEMLRQRAEDHGEDWPASLWDFPYYEGMPGLREQYQDQALEEARRILRAAGVTILDPPP